MISFKASFSNQPPFTLLLPNTLATGPARIIVRLDIGGETFSISVKHRNDTLFSYNGSEGAYHTTLVFEFIDNNWLLTSKTDM